MRAAHWLVSVLSAVVLVAINAQAQPVSVDGVVFSDELGGFVVVGASGSGSTEDPFIVYEEIIGPGAAVLVVRGITAAFGNRIGTLHPTGFALKKVVVNRTPFSWTFMDFELQENLGTSSDYFDGLSFGQGAVSGKPFRSNRYNLTSQLNEPVDSVTFYDGELRPGETGVFNVVITETTPTPVFYLVQRPNRPFAHLAARRSPGEGRW
ncbi:MAG: hypothetical protein IIA73_03875 [Proteobacteria bacterium]|nr:hypothetical protein [Pseudomonadota bacterium]